MLFDQNFKHIRLLILGSLIYVGCQDSTKQVAYDSIFIRSRMIICGTTVPYKSTANFFSFTSFNDSIVKIDHPRYLEANKASGFSLIVANDNRIPAGINKNDKLTLNLEVKWGDFRMETPDRPGLKLVALGEVGKQASIPAPLVRVKSGTSIHAKITNTLLDSTITVYGFQKRPYNVADSLFILPGKAAEVTFEAGKAGTYMYWVKLGKGHKIEGLNTQEDEQLAGAFIVDPQEGSPKDRVFVINIFSNRNDSEGASPKLVESLTINGLSWPFTEKIKPSVGDVLNWRVINASDRNHPMHLHGFYFNVLERGNTQKSTIFTKEKIPSVVTETLRGRTTMNMQWEVKRPGNWLFHCHLSFHVASGIRLPGAADADPEGTHQHMAGLVLGIQVKDGPSDLISKGQARNIILYVNESKEGHISFNLKRNKKPKAFTPGPLLILKQYQQTYITVKNQMSEETSIHWHGLEIDSWSDGVPFWSSSDGRSSPIIKPGEEFTYKLSLMRPGTFVYHSHWDDIPQLTKGLYGPMIILDENEVYNPKLDHTFIMGWKNEDPSSIEDVDLNGWDEVPVQKAKTGETHRLRLINIGPAGNADISVTKEGKAITVKSIAKDGADLPISQQVDVERTAKLYVGETADFNFTPTEPGIYEMKLRYMDYNWIQKWVVK